MHKKHPANIETQMLYGKTQTMGIVHKVRKPSTNADIDDALQLVIELAYQNTIDRFDNPSEYRRQMAALDLVKQTFSRSGGGL